MKEKVGEIMVLDFYIEKVRDIQKQILIHCFHNGEKRDIILMIKYGQDVCLE